MIHLHEFFIVVLCIVSSIFWRMGGAAGYTKNWRRLGSSLCMLAIVLLGGIVTPWWRVPVSYALFAWGCWSYFGWLNPWTNREYWYNFLAAAVVTQLGFLVLCHTMLAIVIAVATAVFGVGVKVWADRDKDGWILLWRKDVFSEVVYCLIMCLGLAWNVLVNT